MTRTSKDQPCPSGSLEQDYVTLQKITEIDVFGALAALAAELNSPSAADKTAPRHAKRDFSPQRPQVARQPKAHKLVAPKASVGAGAKPQTKAQAAHAHPGGC